MKYNFWFVVGSQFLYGPEVLETVEARAKEMAAELSKMLPYPLVYKVTAKTNKEITDVVKETNYDDSCAGRSSRATGGMGRFTSGWATG